MSERPNPEDPGQTKSIFSQLIETVFRSRVQTPSDGLRVPLKPGAVGTEAAPTLEDVHAETTLHVPDGQDTKPHDPSDHKDTPENRMLNHESRK